MNILEWGDIGTGKLILFIILLILLNSIIFGTISKNKCVKIHYIGLKDV